MGQGLAHYTASNTPEWTSSSLNQMNLAGLKASTSRPTQRRRDGRRARCRKVCETRIRVARGRRARSCRGGCTPMPAPQRVDQWIEPPGGRWAAAIAHDFQQDVGRVPIIQTAEQYPPAFFLRNALFQREQHTGLLTSVNLGRRRPVVQPGRVSRPDYSRL